MPPQDTSLWHKDYLELKAVEKKQTQEKFSALFPPPRRIEDVNHKKQGPTSISPESSQKNLCNFTNSPLTSTGSPMYSPSHNLLPLEAQNSFPFLQIYCPSVKMLYKPEF